MRKALGEDLRLCFSSSVPLGWAKMAMMEEQHPDPFFTIKKQQIHTNIYSNSCQIKFPKFKPSSNGVAVTN
jgi:hypothetical protein